MTTTAQTTKNGNVKTKSEVSEEKFYTVTTNPLQYKPESCGSEPLQGKIISLEKMPYAIDDVTKEATKPWYVFNIQLTKATKGVDVDDDLKTAESGEMIRLPINAELKMLWPHFQAATKAGKLIEVWIKPKGKANLGGGKTMWRYDVKMDAPNTREDRPVDLPATIDSSNSNFGNIFPESTNHPQLTSGDSDSPF